MSKILTDGSDAHIAPAFPEKGYLALKRAQAFRDAETQKLWSQPDRLAYVQQQLIGPNL